MNRHRFDVTLDVQGPVLSRAVATGALGIDALALKDREGNPVLPGTLLRGMLRQAWGDIGVAPSLVHEYLGGDAEQARKPDKDVDAYRLQRAPLRFAEYFSAHPGDSREGFRHRIRVEPDTGAVTGGGLVVIESLFAPGQRACFSGWVELRLPTDAVDGPCTQDEREPDADTLAMLRRLLEKGFAWLPAVGAQKGVGFGRVLGVRVAPAKPYVPPRATPAVLPAALRTAPAAAAPASLAIGLKLLPDAPFCFPLPGPKGSLGNRFRSGEAIPGAALKAALAAVWPGDEKADELRRCYFEDLRITQALPARGESRPLAIPASLAAVGQGIDTAMADFALHPERALRQDPAPRFAVDWKAPERRRARQHCGWPADPPERALVVRNAIDPERGTVRFDPATDGGLLFSMETLVPDGYLWLANLSIPDVAAVDREPLLDLLETLLAPGLGPLGKTKVFAAVVTAGEPWRFHGTGARDRLLLDEGRCVLCLQSRALLLPRGLTIPSVNGGQSLAEAYAEAFHDLSGGSLSLRDHFATQSLGGGNYWWHGFRHCAEPYQPVLLTEPGSVFVLEVAEGRDVDAQGCLADWLARGMPTRGLPLLGAARQLPVWRQNPWLRENGYGEVTVNSTLHLGDPPPATGSFAEEE
ncbi:hypothetical protein CKO31_19790 [Thiohalocapsa halophila]|uniref:Uncharacterized protein n=1 Tax=Thiohalocapsa halophila TaxID=69359 RepID=A0ABS1CNJ8_9GAMM|nr:hypothetical protein [Thiohalocapsa halophila]MBK1632951.1 hypothetical protein [Thiohalocapsa halophila]